MNTVLKASLLKLHLCLLVCCGFLSVLSSCDRRSPAKQEVVLYTSIDQPVAAPIVAEFTKQTGIKIRLVTDGEANKTVGLVERIRAEKDRPQADVWWGNEPFNSVLLAEEKLLQSSESDATRGVSIAFRDAQYRWIGTGYRERVLAFHIPTTGALTAPSLDTLLDPKWSGRVAIARPTAGTTGSHVAAIYAALGDAAADRYFRRLRENGVVLLGGNGAVAEAVASGQIALGLTDNDDVLSVRREKGVGAIDSVHLAGPGGRLILPTTVGLVAGRPANASARQLIDYLTSPAVESSLTKAGFAAGSLRDLPSDPDATTYADIARIMPKSIRRATLILEGRE